MCISSPPKPEKPSIPSPPPPEPELSEPEQGDQTKDNLKRQAEGTEKLRIDRTRISTGDKRSGLQVNRASGSKNPKRTNT